MSGKFKQMVTKAEMKTQFATASLKHKFRRDKDGEPDTAAEQTTEVPAMSAADALAPPMSSAGDEAFESADEGTTTPR